jgi:ribonuclease BN (tRNA processing enzyme)
MLSAAGLELRSIGYALYSHIHLDHTADLMPFLFTSTYHPAPRRERLTIGGSGEFLRWLQQLKSLYPKLLPPEAFELSLVDTEREVLRGEGWTVRTARVDHHPSSIAFRIDETGGRAFVYSGDTGYSRALISLAAGCHTLLAECSFPDRMEVDGHLTPALAGRTAREAGVERLVLTHFYPPCDEVDRIADCAKEFDGEIVSARDLMVLEI